MALIDETNPARFYLYTSGPANLVCEACDKDILRTATDVNLMVLTDAALTHVCKPKREGSQ